MVAQLLEGAPVAAAIRSRLMADLAGLRAHGIVPRLMALYFQGDPGSLAYVRKHRKACEEAGILCDSRELSAALGEEELAEILRSLNDDPAVTGILLQTPLPPRITASRMHARIDPCKDVEGLHPANMGGLLYGTYRVAPCTAVAAVELLRTIRPSLKGLEVTVIGHSKTVGKPLALLLLESSLEAPTPTVCHVATVDLEGHARRADVLIVAVGVPELVRGSMIKPGAVVVDIGINLVEVRDPEGRPVLDAKGAPKRRLVGDVEFAAARAVASWITPVPGGVGPVTVQVLLRNTVECAKMLFESGRTERSRTLDAPRPVASGQCG
ncbi:MAG: bifunctional 5,10-methylenetetrahydrofolate dehydrogenase/5,10-methenyltetrahydrofolate cyclohydrolase [Planctomycetes bacterium]|nr:bifunctional 5,10-methylenetetrahydrofolate dehydrogenase/5,10-methenyltetrahydrofolate cyclohydrolase [Planctomycetota bacterium]